MHVPDAPVRIICDLTPNILAHRANPDVEHVLIRGRAQVGQLLAIGAYLEDVLLCSVLWYS